jgi:hypothetical protein
LEGNSDGWLIKYYPNALYTYGGYTLFAKFTNETDVQLTSDINSNVVHSSYVVRQGAGPVLSFNGYNKVIHYFSEPGADSGVGSGNYGMEGDFEFLVLEYSEDLIVLKGNKSGNRYEMYPLAAGEFETLPIQYQAEADFFGEFNKFELIDTKGEIQDIIFRNRTFQEAKEGENPLLPFRIVPNGIEFMQEYSIDGVSLNRLLFKEPTAEYPYGYYTDSSDKIKIYPVLTPLNQWFASNLWAMSYNNVGPLGKTYWDAARANLATNGVVVNNMYIGDAGVQVIYYVLQNGAVEGAVGHDLIPEPGTTDEVTIRFTGSLYNVANFSAAYWTAGLNQFTTPMNGRTFVITSDVLDRPDEILLTDKLLPNNTFRLFLDDIDDPLNN